MQTQSNRRTPRGLSLFELTIVLAILGIVFVGIMLFMKVVATGLNSETVESDQQTRAAGQMYDILSELRQATAQSPNFLVPATSITNTSVPPSITFDLPSTTNSAGAIVWGSKVTYRLALNPGHFIDAAETIYDARILRDELAVAGGIPTTSCVEEHVPFQITEGGVTYWGFSVSVSANAVTVAIRKSGDTGVNLGTTTQATRSTQGKLATAVYTGTYYLRNSQVAAQMP